MMSPFLARELAFTPEGGGDGEQLLAVLAFEDRAFQSLWGLHAHEAPSFRDDRVDEDSGTSVPGSTAARWPVTRGGRPTSVTLAPAAERRDRQHDAVGPGTSRLVTSCVSCLAREARAGAPCYRWPPAAATSAVRPRRRRDAWSTHGLHGRQVVRQRRDPLRPVEEVGQVGRQRRADAGGLARRRRGTWPGGRWPARPSARPGRGRPAGRAEPDRGVGVDEQPGRAVHVSAMTASGRRRRRAGRRRRPARASGELVGLDRQRARSPGTAAAARRSGRRRGGSARTAAARSSSSTWMSMLGLSVGTTRLVAMMPVCEEAGEDVVAVRADDEPVDGQRPSRRAIQPASTLPKLPGRHRERTGRRPGRRRATAPRSRSRRSGPSRGPS